MLVLDTHILVWWVNNDKALSKTAACAIRATRASGDELIVSSISTWEICMLIRKGRMALRMDLDQWLDLIAAIEGLRFVPVDNAICRAATALPGDFHKDPADRMIVATARKFGAPLVTADEKILQYEHATTLS